MKKLLVAALGIFSFPLHAETMFAACTMHQGLVVCFEVPVRQAESGAGPCYEAQKNMVSAQDFAARNADKAEVIGKIMGFASDQLFKQCAWPAPVPAKFSPTG